LLSPTDFGLIAMIAVISGIAEMFSQMGVGDAIIQHPRTLGPVQLSTLFWINCALGMAAYVVVFLALPVITTVYREPMLDRLIPIAAISFVISPMGLQISALLRKSLRFELLAFIEVGKAIVSTGTAIVGASIGWGVWALVAGQLSGTICATAALLFIGATEKWLPSFNWKLGEVRSILSFGGYFFASNLVNYINSRIDQILIGSLLGAQELGYYSMAFNFVVQPAAKINTVLTQVAFPILARVRDEKTQLKRWYLKMLNILATVNAPALIGLAAVSPLIVSVFLGEQWSPIVPVLQILAVFTVIRSAGNAGGTLVYATGNARLALFWNIGLLTAIPFAVFVGARTGGLLGVSVALTVIQTGLVLLWYPVAVQRLVGRCFWPYINSFFAPTIMAAVMGVAVWQTGSLLKTWPQAIALPALISVGVAGYVGAYYLIFRAQFKEYASLLLNRAFRPI